MTLFYFHEKIKFYAIINNMQMSKNSKYNGNNGVDTKRKRKIQKEHFYPNHYHKDAMHDCMNEFGSMTRNSYYSKPERKKLANSIKRLRVLGLLPFCSKHYFHIFKDNK